jgi:nitrous oxidase accessory protein NosD
VDDTGCDTIKVSAGTYNENVVIDRSVVLKGAKAGDSATSRSFPSGSESTVAAASPAAAVFSVEAADVTIDGFAVTNPGGGLGVIVKTAGSGAVIKNNLIDTIGGSTFVGPTVGIYLEQGPDNVDVVRNKVAHVESGPTAPGGSAQGVLVGDSLSANPSLNVYIAKNLFTDFTSATKGAYGVQVNNGASTLPAATGYATVEIDQNKIQNLSGNWVHGVGLEGDAPDAGVFENTFSNLVDTNPTAGVQDAVAVFLEDNPSYLTSEINFNKFNISDDAFGIAVAPTLAATAPNASVDGECNWWNDKTGPSAVGVGNGAHVGPNVDYKPWWVKQDGKCEGGVATKKKQCQNDGWKDLTDDEGRAFSDEDDCVNFVEDNNHDDNHHWNWKKDWNEDRN